MKIKIRAFGIVKEIFGSNEISVELADGAKTGDLQYILEEKYPKLKELKSYLVAVNNERALPRHAIEPNDIVAVIPPVSGG